MTKEYEEMLVRKFGWTLHYNSGPKYSFTPSQFAALIAVVRRQAMEEAAKLCTQAIRDVLEEGK